MDLNDIVSQLGLQDGISLGVIIVIFLSLIQVSKLKIDPWTALGRCLLIPFKAIGRELTADVVEKMDKLSDEIDSLSREIETIEREAGEDRKKTAEHRAVSTRMRILRFGDEVRSGLPHSLEHYDEVMNDITTYMNYCNNHPNFKNQKAVSTIELVTTDYNERLKTNDFL